MRRKRESNIRARRRCAAMWCNVCEKAYGRDGARTGAQRAERAQLRKVAPLARGYGGTRQPATGMRTQV
eukprot:scaffold284300_cov30-Tisochrysis_lutea.AAC.1